MISDESEKLTVKTVSSETDLPFALLYDNNYQYNDYHLRSSADENGISVNVTIGSSVVSYVILHASPYPWNNPIYDASKS